MANDKITFEKLLAETKKLSGLEVRVDEEQELEIVLKAGQLDLFGALAHNFFGVPFKPKGQAPSKEAENLTEPFGGIRDNQTLYYIKDNDRCCFAMMWPWGDGKLVTVKIFRT